MPDPDVVPPTPLEFAARASFIPDDWQADVLTSDFRKRILCCSRQAGKSCVTAIGALHEGCTVPGSLVLLLSPSLRQSGELFRKVMQFYHRLEGDKPGIVNESTLRLELDNGSRVIALPGSETTTRGYSAATLVVIDEAARVADDLIAAVRPALATTNGRMIALSTPAGKVGWFWKTWSEGQDWERTMVKASDCARISPEFLEDERRELGEFLYMQEYELAFLDPETSVFSSDLIARALTRDITPLFRQAA